MSDKLGSGDNEWVGVCKEGLGIIMLIGIGENQQQPYQARDKLIFTSKKATECYAILHRK